MQPLLGTGPWLGLPQPDLSYCDFLRGDPALEERADLHYLIRWFIKRYFQFL